jgi:acyl-CoA synthetase (NDP forming)
MISQSSQKDDVLARIFWARSVAMVGASTNPSKLGHIILKNIIDGGFSGEIYPINPNAEAILGMKCYPDLPSVPGDIDVMVFCIPGKLIPAMMPQAAAKNALCAVIISGGFRETGNLALEQELVASARENGIRIIGPNCQGFNFTPNKLCASWPLITKHGSLAVISQSGTVAATMAGWAENENVGITGVVSLGNQSDLCETDFIKAFGEDEQTKVIAMYIEGVREGRRFIKEVKRLDKPVIVLKSGRTPAGEIAAASHTKSLAGRDEVFAGVCQQLGIVRADSLEELFDFAKGFCNFSPPKGNRLMIITSSGGSGILSVDVAEENGLRIASLDDKVRQAFRDGTLPASAVINNPMDLTGDGQAADFQEALQIAEDHDIADMYLIIFGDPIPDAALHLEKTLASLNKPYAICYLGGGAVQEAEVAKFRELKIPVYPSPERGTRLLAAQYYHHTLIEEVS